MVDLDWIVALADPAWPAVEFSLMSHDESASSLSALTVEVDADAGVRCSFARGPDRNVVNALSPQ